MPITPIPLLGKYIATLDAALLPEVLATWGAILTFFGIALLAAGDPSLRIRGKKDPQAYQAAKSKRRIPVLECILRILPSRATAKDKLNLIGNAASLAGAALTCIGLLLGGSIGGG